MSFVFIFLQEGKLSNVTFLTKLGLLSASDLICKLLVVDIYGHMYTFLQFPLGVTMVMGQTMKCTC